MKERQREGEKGLERIVECGSLPEHERKMEKETELREKKKDGTGTRGLLSLLYMNKHTSTAVGNTLAQRAKPVAAPESCLAHVQAPSRGNTIHITEDNQ